MIENVERNDNFKTEKGIGLYKIRYEMDVKGSSKDQAYTAGIIAYTSEEAINTLVKFAKNKVKGFKGLKIDEVSFDGGCHALSDPVKAVILKTAMLEGTVISKDDHEEMLKKVKSKKTGAKKSIIPPKED